MGRPKKEHVEKEPITPERLGEIVTRILVLGDERKMLGEDQTELKKEAYEGGVSKKGLNEALRLAKIPKDERDLFMTKANQILINIGRGEIDLESYN